MNKDDIYNKWNNDIFHEMSKYRIIGDIPEKTSQEKLDEIPLVDIERYLRKKKLENIDKK